MTHAGFIGDCKCECSDPQCPECKGHCNHTAVEVLWRIDMDDESGTAFCDQCAADALESGVFTDADSDADGEDFADSFYLHLGPR